MKDSGEDPTPASGGTGHGKQTAVKPYDKVGGTANASYGGGQDNNSYLRRRPVPSAADTAAGIHVAILHYAAKVSALNRHV